MATTMLIIFVILLSIGIIPLIAAINLRKPHHIDLMAGDEGED